MSGTASESAASPEDPVVDLVLQLKAGNGQALEPLIEQTQDKGWQIAYAILQNRQEVEDALQDAYLLVFQNISQLQEPRAFWGWFKRILVHRCLRLRQRQPLEVLEEEPPVEAEPVAERLDLRGAFAHLSRTDQTVLGLREILDWTYDEIAAALQVPLTTVKNRLHNARQRLFRLLGGTRGGSPS